MTASFLGLGEAIASPFLLPVFAAELEDIQERGFLIVAVKDNLRPLGFRTEQGDLTGFEIDIARQLAVELFGTPEAVVLQPVNNQDRLPTLLNDDVDIVIAQLSRTDARSRMVDFSTPYYLDGVGLITRHPRIQTLPDVANATIAVLNDSTTIAIVRSLFPEASLVGVDSYQDALATLESNQADVFASDATILTGWAQDYPSYRVLPSLISAEALAIAMPRGLQYEDLRQAINTAIERWHDDGWLREREIHWGLP
jgi:polar amino acid transport system substrate-binding protein